MSYLLLLLIFLLTQLSSTTTCLAQCLTSQSSALLQLKQSFLFVKNDSDIIIFARSSLTSWLPTADCCHWEGLVCADPASGMVTSLDLSYLLISGNLSPSLYNLTSLTSLNLGFNNFDGPIPDSFHLLPKLTNLNLSNNNFTGQIPISISTLTHLISLDLSTGFFDETSESSLKLHDPDLRTLIKNLRGLRELYLNGVYIDCAVPEFIGDFTSLRKLSLNSCGLKGELPDISKLRNLALLDLQNNSLTGPIKPSFFSLPWLQVLQLSQNRLSGLLQEFVNPSPLLSIVDLSNNNLQGQIPSSVFNLFGLKILGLSSNNFSGAIDLSLFIGLRNLSSLDLSNNRLSVKDGTTNDSSLSFSNMDTLKLVACNLTKIPFLLRNMTTMGFLDLSNNRISGSIPNWIWRIWSFNLSHNFFTNVERPLPQLSGWISRNRFIDLHSNMLQGPIPLPATSPYLLDYSNNNFTSIIPSNISHYLVNTTYFSVSNNSLNGAIPPLICTNYLGILDLGLNKLTGPIPRCLMGYLETLVVLNLRHNQLTGPIPNPSPVCWLQTINVNGNKLSGKLPPTLTNCSTLEVLDLGNNHFHDSFPFWLTNLQWLQVLVLRSNQFYGTVSNLTFPMLQIFDISSNNFNGVLSPECFSSFKSMMQGSSSMVSHPDLTSSYQSVGLNFHYVLTVIFKNEDMTLEKSLTMFTYVDLSNNKFEGEIPEGIGELTWLYMLNMSHNLLTGRIPVSLGGLVELESLDLSSNHLSGEIPKELVVLTFLSVLNLSDNKLVGRIPQGGQMLTFGVDAFQGNEGLCGLPLVKMCSTLLSNNESKDEVVSDPIWELGVVVVSGFVTGLAVVFGGLMYWEKGRKLFEEKVDRLTWVLLDSVGWCKKYWKVSSVSETTQRPA